MKRLVWLGVIVLVLSILAGCQAKTETSGSKVKVSGKKVEVQNEQGKSEISIGNEGEVAIPDGYPSNIVPIMEGAKVTSATKGADGSFNILLTSKKSVAEIKAYYEKVLAGLSNLQKQEAADVINMMGTKDDKTVVLNITEDMASGTNQRIISISIVPAE